MGSQIQVTHSTTHGSLSAIFFLSYFIRTLVSCVALEKIIHSFGVAQLPLHYGLACAVTLLGSWALVIVPRIGPRFAFTLVHSGLLVAGIGLYLSQDPFLKSWCSSLL